MKDAPSKNILPYCLIRGSDCLIVVKAILRSSRVIYCDNQCVKSVVTLHPAMEDAAQCAKMVPYVQNQKIDIILFLFCFSSGRDMDRNFLGLEFYCFFCFVLLKHRLQTSGMPEAETFGRKGKFLALGFRFWPPKLKAEYGRNSKKALDFLLFVHENIANVNY